MARAAVSDLATFLLDKIPTLLKLLNLQRSNPPKTWIGAEECGTNLPSLPSMEVAEGFKDQKMRAMEEAGGEREKTKLFVSVYGYSIFRGNIDGGFALVWLEHLCIPTITDLRVVQGSNIKR